MTSDERINKAICLGKQHQNNKISNHDFIQKMYDLETAYMLEHFGIYNGIERCFLAIIVKSLLNQLERSIASDVDDTFMYEYLKRTCRTVTIEKRQPHGQ